MKNGILVPPFSVVIENGVMNIRYNDLTKIMGVVDLKVEQYCRDFTYATFECWVNRKDIDSLSFDPETKCFKGLHGEDLAMFYQVLCYKPKTNICPFEKVVAFGRVNLFWNTKIPS